VTPDGMVLGLRLPGAEQRFDSLLEEHTHQLAPGDVIVLYTDGITEARSPDNDLYGTDRLDELLAHQCHSSQELIDALMTKVNDFTNHALPNDDRTVHPDLERFVAERMGATTYELDSSHVPMLSHPDLVLDVIRTAANAVQGSAAAAAL